MPDAFIFQHPAFDMPNVQTECAEQPSCPSLPDAPCQLPDFPVPQDLEGFLLGDLPGFDLDLDSMMGELEALSPDLSMQQDADLQEDPQLQPQLGRMQSNGSHKNCSLDSKASSGSLFQLQHRESSPGASSRHVEADGPTGKHILPPQSAGACEQKAAASGSEGDTSVTWAAKPLKR